MRQSGPPRTSDLVSALQKFQDILSLQIEPPTIEFLRRIVPVHLERVPYESASKILFGSDELRLPTLGEYVDRIARYGFGGTCYANNIYFVELLKFLGFNAELNSADSLEAVDSHVSCKVHIEGKAYVVDFGNMTHFAGPFLLAPCQRQVAERGDNRFVLTPDLNGQTYRLEFYRAEKLIRVHQSKLGAKDVSFFQNQILKSYHPTAYWMQIFNVCKHVGDTTLGIWNTTFFRQQGLEVEKKTLQSVDDLKSVLATELSLDQIPVDEILSKMRFYSSVSFF